jgi:hypothetical protein
MDWRAFSIDSGGVTATITFLILLFAWIIGILLVPVSDWLWRKTDLSKKGYRESAGRYWTVFQCAVENKVITHNCDKFKIASAEERCLDCCAFVQRQVYHQIHEYLKSTRNDWRGMVMKLQAEARFYQNVLGTVVVIIVGGLAFQKIWFGVWWSPGAGRWAFSMLPLVLIGVGAWFGWREKVNAQWERHFAMLAVSLRARGLLK